MQRIIEVEGENPAPEVIAKSKADGAVFNGLAAIFLVLIAIGAAAYLLKKQHHKK